MIRRISAEGLKGGDGSLDLAPVTVVTGPNGRGKSAVIDAIRFVTGVGDVCGVSPNGPGLRAALRGALTVTAETDGGTICRTRGASAARATLTSGVGFEGWALHADAVSGLLASSIESVEVALAVVGAAVSRVGLDAVTRRDETAAAVAKAHSERRRAEDAAETSRKAAGDATPDAEARARAALADAAAAAEEAAKALERHEAALAAYAKAEQRRAELANIEQTVATTPEPDVETPRAFLADALADEVAATESYNEAKLAAMAAQTRSNAAAERDAVCSSGSCPTCGQTVGPDVQIATADLRRQAAEAHAAAVAVVTAAGSRLSDARADRQAWKAAAAQAEEARSRLESAKAQAAWLRTQTVEAVEAVSLDTVEAARSVLLQRQRVRKDAETALAAAVRGHERYRRWRSDLAARDQVEARLEEAKAAHAAAQADLEQFVRVGAKAVTEDAQRILPADWTVAYFEGRFGLRLGPYFVTGAGLSGAQRALLAATLDYCAASIVARTQAQPVEAPPFMLEADALDRDTLAAVLEALSELVVAGKLPQAIIATCHPAPAGPWHVIDLGGNSAATPEPVPARAKWPAPGFSLTPDEAPAAPPEPAAEPEGPPPADPAQPSLFDGDFGDDFDGSYAPAEENLDLFAPPADSFDAPAGSFTTGLAEGLAIAMANRGGSPLPVIVSQATADVLNTLQAAVAEASPADSLEAVWPTPPAPEPAPEAVQSPGISEAQAAALLAGTSAAAVRALWSEYGGAPPEKMTLTVSRAALAERIAERSPRPETARAQVEAAKAAHPKRKAQPGAEEA